MEFQVKADPELWQGIGVDVTRLSKMREILSQMYKTLFLNQETRPEGMKYFDEIVANIHTGRIKEIVEAKEEGRVVVGAFCVYIPEEIVVALDGICIGLCGGSQATIPDAERILPRSICPLVKSAYGFRISRVCPYFQVVDFVAGETTCDSKKKTWEILNQDIETYVMEIPPMKRETERELLFKEVVRFKEELEQKSGIKLDEERLLKGVRIINRKRKALQRLNSLRQHDVLPISGKDALLIEQIAYYDHPERFATKVEELCDELEDRISNGIGYGEKKPLRIMISGTPMAFPNFKLHNIVENLGAIIVNEESCIGTRYFNDLAEEKNNLTDQLYAIVDRSMKVHCAIFTPNEERIERILEEYKKSKADGLIYYSLTFCQTYLIEAVKVKQACEMEGIPFLMIESDYSPEDVGQLQTRVEAFLETLKG
jgi:benzoyl-CoA reductase/2-hydroxyglutaryl-CoA dehydratase subunit BcrC/BadD/HgdB